MLAKPQYTIFIGNPGVGKSTLLNALIGRVKFKSGISFGNGLTQHLQLHEESPGVFYGDTPGLDDSECRQRAANEIAKGLRRSETTAALYKLVFVVTTEAGRIKPSDLATMRIVLDALPNTKEVPYGVVVNKMSKALVERLKKDPGSLNKLIGSLSPGEGYKTPTVIFYPRRSELEDSDNVLHAVQSVLPAFLQILEPVVIEPEKVSDLRVDGMEELILQLEKMSAEKRELEEEVAMNSYKKQFVHALGVGFGAVGGAAALAFILIPK